MTSDPTRSGDFDLAKVRKDLAEATSALRAVRAKSSGGGDERDERVAALFRSSLDRLASAVAALDEELLRNRKKG